MNWKQKIEATIADLHDEKERCPHCVADELQALLDVAVAADKLQLDGGDRQSGARSYYATGPVAIEFRVALDKLREVE